MEGKILFDLGITCFNICMIIWIWRNSTKHKALVKALVEEDKKVLESMKEQLSLLKDSLNINRLILDEIAKLEKENPSIVDKALDNIKARAIN